MVKEKIGKASALALTRTALMGAVLYVSQIALSFLPNIEIVTLLVVIFTKHFGKEGTFACFIYVYLTSLTSGFGIWWFTYLIVWPLFSLLVYRFRNVDSWFFWAFVNGLFGLCFGAIFAIPYIFVSPAYALSYWIGGIPFDIAHCAGNAAAALILGYPIDSAMKRISKYTKQKS